MKVYTKQGDKGTTSLIKTKNIPKSDDRIQLVGTMDELTSQIGMIRCRMALSETAALLKEIQNNLMTIMAGVADPYNIKYRLKEEQVLALEQEIDRMEGLFARRPGFVLPGDNPLSAQIDVTRTVARRCERWLSLVSIRYGADNMAKKYLNRLSDYFYILARYVDDLARNGQLAGADKQAAAEYPKKEEGESVMEKVSEQMSEQVIREVMKRIGQGGKITLRQAKRLIERVEEYAGSTGLQAVIAVCGPDGNPVAVHVMDDAYLVSFEVALKKAYTSASVKMSTMELAELIKPGNTFQGLDKLQGDKMVFFGGGVPLFADGRLIGALGVSGGTGEQDNGIAQYALKVLPEILEER